MPTHKKTGVLYIFNHATSSTTTNPHHWKLIRSEQLRLFSFWLGIEGDFT